MPEIGDGAVLDYASIRKSLDVEKWTSDENDASLESRCVFLGTTMSLFPSGKFWTIWACSNVESAEMAADMDWYHEVETVFASMSISFENGPDPCDCFAVEYRDKAEVSIDLVFNTEERVRL